MKSEEKALLVSRLFLIALVFAYSVFLGMYIHELRLDEITAFTPPAMAMFVFRIGPIGFMVINGVLIALFLFRERLFRNVWIKRTSIVGFIVLIALNALVLLSLLSIFSGQSI